MNIDLENNIKEWASKKGLSTSAQDIWTFFQLSIENILIPEKTWFKIGKTYISLVIGGIYLSAFRLYQPDKGIWLLLDKSPEEDIDGFEFKIVKSTKRSAKRLIWAHSGNIENVNNIIHNNDIWKSHRKASVKILNYPISADQDEKQKRFNKIRISDILGKISEDQDYYQNKFVNAVEQSQKLSKEARLRRLSNADKSPNQVRVTQVIFQRNPDVVAEVLERAGGICEACKKPAPFLRKSDNSPYLEVHHIVALADDGDDTIENAIALCPNCHRKYHYGIIAKI
ncbi:HNH endonuclease [Pelotomaculum sp. FP]|uniref:HNH endonuclease n=1 Tax=Pelotomaculum sp. FP TaxID=261474 RepID=UPI0010650F0C|nr:HNH endonuclease signature motif containing protein [Pelotomaculum sp. FP]TEB11768.1 HNH endonuclease [Pelotomaculum sp. FP]